MCSLGNGLKIQWLGWGCWTHYRRKTLPKTCLYCLFILYVIFGQERQNDDNSANAALQSPFILSLF